VTARTDHQGDDDRGGRTVREDRRHGRLDGRPGQLDEAGFDAYSG
jgi:hypothetical protein